METSMTPLRIFIGSSSEARATATWVSAELEKANHQPKPWFDLGMFRPSEYFLPELIRISESVDAAIFVFAEDDRLSHRNTQVSQARDNVLIEYGLFVGKLGRAKTLICVDGNPKIATDLRGMAVIDVSKQHSARQELKKWLDRLYPEIRLHYHDSTDNGVLDQLFLKVERDEVGSPLSTLKALAEIFCEVDEAIVITPSEAVESLIRQAIRWKNIVDLQGKPHLSYALHGTLLTIANISRAKDVSAGKEFLENCLNDSLWKNSSSTEASRISNSVETANRILQLPRRSIPDLRSYGF